MSQDFRWIIPSPPPQADILEAHHLATEFRREVEYREDFKNYCEWYRQTSLKHQQELEKMRNDINILGWFLGK